MNNLKNLKVNLNQEGLFDKEYKKPIPRYPRRVGIVTALLEQQFKIWLISQIDETLMYN